ncbi:MAG TPA: DUF4097 family beta strand repeat-containing protein [Actinoplanes sp.]|nr:DUF4097 family beta strand repeat-containing protein [Actinoplanes sp.]
MTSRRAAALVLLAAATAAVLAGCGGVGARLTFNDTEPVKVTEIVMTGGSGDVTVRTAAIDETRISRIVHRNSDPGRTYRLDGTVLHIDTDCGRNCSVSYVIEAPAGVAVRGELRSGDVGMDGVGAADIVLTSGDISVRNAVGMVTARSTSGDIDVLNARKGATLAATSGNVRAINVGGGPVGVRVTSGDVEVKLTAPGSVTAETTSGDVNVIVPAGDYRVGAAAGSGDVQVNGIVDNPTSKNVINVHTGSGDATVSAQPAA